MKFLSYLLIQGLLINLHAITLESNSKLTSFSMIIETDYEPTAKAFAGVKYITSEYQTFREQVAKNTSIEYGKCIEYIKTHKCNNIDQWQSVIEELKLENSNSVEIEVPFLEKQKTSKIQKLSVLLEQSEEYDNRLQEIAIELQEHKNGLIESSRQISVMYKLPEEDKNSFIQQNKSSVDTLNSDVPDIARSELAKAKTQYDIADQSIQARAAQNVLNTASEKMVETLGHLQKAFEQKIADLREEKKMIKDDILRLRALIANENGIQAKNTQKIGEMELLIEGCKGRPTNIEKDCEPIKLRAAKLNTEIDIVNSRTQVLFQELGTFMRANINAEQILTENQEQKKLQEELDKQKQEELSYLMEDNYNQTGSSYIPNEPKELNPIHHLSEVYEKKETVKMENSTETQQKA